MSKDGDYFPKTNHGTSFAGAPGPVVIDDTDASVNGVPLTFPPGEDASSFFGSPIVLSRFDDFYFGHNGEVSGGGGDDRIIIDEPDATARGDAGNDNLGSGQNGGVTAYGGSGNDTLHAADMTGGSGNDTFLLDFWLNETNSFSNAGATVEDFQPGKDQIEFENGAGMEAFGGGNTDPSLTNVDDLWTVHSTDQHGNEVEATFHIVGITELTEGIDYQFDLLA